MLLVVGPPFHSFTGISVGLRNVIEKTFAPDPWSTKSMDTIYASKTEVVIRMTSSETFTLGT